MLRKVIVFSFFLWLNLTALHAYEVEFEGDIPEKTLTLLKTASQLIKQQNSPPSTAAGLRHRAEADVEDLLIALHSQAYYNATVDFQYDFKCNPPRVIIKVNTGPVYPIAGFYIESAKDSVCQNFSYKSIALEDIGICLGDPAYPKTILEAEENILEILTAEGYPLSIIEDRDVVADQSIQAIYVTIFVNSGPLSYFGPTTITGNCSVKEEFFRKKLVWQPGAIYDPCKVERTQANIEASGLFSTITITNAEKACPDGTLPMFLEVVEGKHRSIGWGLSYTTQRGVGVGVEWEHRNIRGLGERLRIDTDIWSDDQKARLLYVKPDYMQRDQDLLGVIEGEHETTKGYIETSFTVSSVIERRIQDHTRFSYGLMYKYLVDERSDVNGTFNLFKIPLQLRWSKANSVLDPTGGHTINVKVIPTAQIVKPQFAYCINTLIATYYQPLCADCQYLLAGKINLGSIWGSNRRTIPSSEKFYAGSESTLRGYHYLTVSPLRHGDKPIGGRSMMIYTLELRVRATESFGYVCFYDVGNVYEDPFPQFDHKVLQDVGFGLRYHTTVGHLRLDFALPLNRRRHLDLKFQLYLSIGQAF
jgi:translocation and assembly module TamA